ncbi:MAG: protein kinase, partial [Chromatiales bacterium]|nr:protein kinase [Chromatiales bacterium]
SKLKTLVVIKEFFPNQLVYRADDGVRVEPNPDYEDEAGHFLESFEKEAQLLATFAHNNIVQVTDVFEANDTAYIVMHYERGETLERRLRSGELRAQADLERLLVPLMEALTALHERGVIHRDIKGDNVIVREDGSPVLIDFGSARVAHGVATQTVTALVTPGYAPIEQFDPDSSRLGPWTDIYALGATLYRALSGKPPTQAFVRSSTLADQRPDPFTPLNLGEYPQYTPAFIHAINASLAFSPQHRPQSTDRWRRQLEGEEIAPPPPGKATLPSGRDEETRTPRRAGTAVAAADADTVLVEEDDQFEAPTLLATSQPEGAATPTEPPSISPAPNPVGAPDGGGKGTMIWGGLGVALAAAALGIWALWPGPQNTIPATVATPAPALSAADTPAPVPAPPTPVATPVPIATSSPAPAPNPTVTPLSVTVPAPQPQPKAASAPPPVAAHTVEGDLATLNTLLGRWAKAWENNTKSAGDYAAFYSPKFKARGLSRAAWVADKDAKGKRTRCIGVGVTDPEVTLSGDRAVVTFEQTYSSDRYCDVGTKTLVLERSDSGWLVVEEEQPSYARCNQFCKVAQ